MTDTPDRSHPAPGAPGAPLVSVVVPFYNVRDWAGRCMDSLLAQDFSSFEVVCVDDGSTDGTAELLDSYAPDPRVTVLHKANGGTAAARNFGVRHARGSLVGFVDHDDFVAPNYLSSLYGALSSTGAELAMCRCVEVAPEELGSFEWPAEDGVPRVETMGRAEVVSEVLYERIPLTSWGKLAPRRIYLDRPFPVGKFFEDVFTFRRHFLALERFALVDAPLYAWVTRPGSATRSAPTREWVLCRAEALDVLESDLADFPEVAGRAADFCIAFEHCWLHDEASRVRPRTARMREVIADSRAHVRRAWPALRHDPEISPTHKAHLWVVARIPFLHVPLLRAWERVKKVLGR